MRRARALVVGTLALAATSGVASCAEILGITDVPDGAAPVEAGADAAPLRMCDPTAPFDQPPVPVALQSADVVSTALSPDGLTAYLTSSNGSLYVATRATVDAGFGVPTAVPGGSGMYRVTVSGDLKRLVWLHFDLADSGLGTDSGLFMVDRSGPDAAFDFSSSSQIMLGQRGYFDSVFLRADGEKLYFRDLAGLNEATADAGFTNASAVTGLPGSADNPAVSPDDLVLYFDMNPPALRVVSRGSPGDSFSNGQVIDLPDAKPYAYVPVMLTADYCTLYVTLHSETDLPDGAVTNEANTLYVLHKTPP